MHEKAVNGTWKESTHYSQHIGPVHGAVASFKQRGGEKIKALVGNQKAMNHNQECTWKSTPLQTTEKDEDLWTNMLYFIISFSTVVPHRLMDNSFPFI